MGHLSRSSTAVERRSSNAASARWLLVKHPPPDLPRPGSAAAASPKGNLPEQSSGPSVQPVYLIVNADDYGYFPCVSRGILDAAREGAVTATGVLANAPFLDQQLGWLKCCPHLDLGVHLNLTVGTPVSNVMRHRLRRWAGQFPGKARMSGVLLSGVVTVADVRVEWQSQIDTCLAHGLRLRFLNSHEHIHMLPSLFTLAHELASQYAIEHVRYPLAEVPQRWTTGSLTRNLVIHCLGWLNRRPRSRAPIPCLGVGESGRLSLHYLRRLVSSLERGRVYELMCHPGYYDSSQINDSRLVSYHDWEQELRVLTSEATLDLFARQDVRLVGYPSTFDIPAASLSTNSLEYHHDLPTETRRG